MTTLAHAKATAQAYKRRIRAAMEEIANANVPNKGVIINRLQTYKQYYKDASEEVKDLSVNDEDLALLLSEAEAEADFMLDIEDAILNGQFQVEEREKRESVGSITSRTSETRAKLPTLTLSTFDGDYLHFTSYWGSFTSSVDERSDITDVDKFNYLFNSLANGSNACIAGLERTAENYETAKTRIFQRYGDVQMRINAHMNALQEVKMCGISTVALRNNYDVIETHLGNIQSLGESLSDKTLLGLLRNKFPSSVIISIEETLTDKEELTVELFRKKLHRYISVRERCESFTLTPDTKSSGFKNNKPFSRSFSSPAQSSSKAPNSGANSGRKPAFNCIFCKEGHWNDDCPKYKTLAARKNQIRGRCFNCFSRDHLQENCNNKRDCRHCGSNDHHRSLCDAYIAKFNVAANIIHGEVNREEGEDTEEVNLRATVAVVSTHSDVYLPAAPVVVSNLKTGKAVSIKMLMDTGSQMTFISERVAQYLNLKPVGKVTINLFRFGSSIPVTTHCPRGEVRIHYGGKDVKIPVIVVPYITNRLLPPSYYADVDFAGNKYPQIKIASPKPDENVEILIGANLYYYFIGPRLLKVRPGLFLSETKFGWVLVGQERPSDLLRTDVFTFMVGCSEKGNETPIGLPYSVQLTKLWDLDSLGIGQEQNLDEDEAVRCFNKALVFENKRYHISWPWRRYPPELPNNYGLAFGRLKSLVKKLQENNILRQYDQVFQEQLQAGVVEPMDERASGIEHYLPHQFVYKDNKTTKLRIVFDASSKTRKNYNSLNDCLYKGRVLLEDLLQILLRFRLHEIAVVSDVEKAFLQLELKTEEDKDVVRFLWLKDPEGPVEGRNLQIFRFRRVVFGVVASPFLLNAIIRYHVLKALEKHPELEPVPHSIYVDNLIMSNESVANLSRIYESSKSVFQEASMNLREWYTNSKQLKDQFRKEDLPKGNNAVTEVLGLIWRVEADELSLKGVKCSEPDDGVFSKTTVLETVASLYDPLGLVSPVTLAGKLFIRKLWVASYDWEKILDDHLTCEWVKLRELLNMVVINFKVPRGVGIGSDATVELHCFADASQQAYSAVLYVRVISGSEIRSNLIFSKARVAPLPSKNKPKLSIPRLELLGATIASRAIDTVRKAIPRISKTFLWSDSQCVLRWLKTAKLLPVFEENRLRQIKQVKNVQYKYVPTELNPADLATRSSLDTGLVFSKNWLNGPEFLIGPEDQWPAWDESKEGGEEETWEEGVFSALTRVESLAKPSPPFGLDPGNFSSISRLLRVTAYCIRFVEGGRHKFSSTIEAEEMERALMLWVEYTQKLDYGIYFLPEAMKKPLHPLKPWVDCYNFKDDTELSFDKKMRIWCQGKILRCATRLGNAALSANEKNPILLPNKQILTKLLIFDLHVGSCHAGAINTLARLREKFYVPKGKAEVRRVILTCIACRKMSVGPYRIPFMGQLPEERVNRTQPFVHCGLDGLGPFPMKENEEVKKVYMLIITCLVTRAIYLVVMEDLTAMTFLQKLREFIGRRGCPETIYCDNAKSFKAVAGVSSRFWLTVVRDESIMRFSVENGRRIKWKFIPALSPWVGGVYERLIALFKNCYKRTVGMIALNKGQMEAIVGEIQGILNSRPLCEINENEYLTPNHFLNVPVISRGPLIEKGKGYIPSTQLRKDILTAWRRGLRILDMFWKLWRTHYLRSLGSRREWKIKQGKIISSVAPRIGEAVLIGDNAPRQEWKIGIVTELFRGSDGFIRSAMVKSTGNRMLHRSVGHLYPYEYALQNKVEPETTARTVEEESAGEGSSLAKRRSGVDIAPLEISEVPATNSADQDTPRPAYPDELSPMTPMRYVGEAERFYTPKQNDKESGRKYTAISLNEVNENNSGLQADLRNSNEAGPSGPAETIKPETPGLIFEKEYRKAAREARWRMLGIAPKSTQRKYFGEGLD